MANETILVVDGDARSRKVLEVGFDKSGYRVVMTETMREALIELEREQPDLVVADTDLSDGDAFDLCKRVQEDPDLGYVPFLFLTDESRLPSEVNGLEIEPDDYLTRPIYLREVTTRATVLLQRRARKLLSESDVEEFEGELSEITMIDLLQTIEAEERTGTVHLEREGRDAVVTFRDGDILNAVCGKLRGEDAVYRLMLWPSGSFVVRYHEDVDGKDRIGPETQDMIVEGIERLQAWDSLTASLPSLERVFEADYQRLPSLLEEAPEPVGRIARLFDGIRSLRDVVDDSPIDDVTTLQVVDRLLSEDVLRDVTPEGEATDEERAESTSHLAEWLESRTDTADPETEVTLKQTGEEGAEFDEPPAEGESTSDESPAPEPEVADDAAATMEDLEKAEEVRRKVEAQQLRQQKVAGEQIEGDDSERGVPQIPGATQEQAGDESVEGETEEEREREDTPRAHPASSQDESVEAWLSQGAEAGSNQPEGEVSDTPSSSSETRPQFPAVDIGDEVVGPDEEQADESPSRQGDSEQAFGEEASVEEPRELAPDETLADEIESPELDESVFDEAAPSDGEEPSSRDIEETPTEPLESDIRPEDLTGELEPAPSEQSGAEAREGPLDVERVSNNGEVVEAEYELSESATTPSESGTLAEETPVQRREPSGEQQQKEDEGASSTQEMWIDQQSPSAPESDPSTESTPADTEPTGIEERPESEWESDESVGADFEAPPPEADAPATADAPADAPTDESQAADEPVESVDESAESDEEAADRSEITAEDTTDQTETADKKIQEGSVQAESESTPSIPEAQRGQKEKADEVPEEESVESDEIEKPEADTETEDESAVEESAGETQQSEESSEQNEEARREGTEEEDESEEDSPDKPAGEDEETPESEAGAQEVAQADTEPEAGEAEGDEGEDEQEDEQEATAASDERITEETKEADFFEQGDQLRETREEDLDWDFEDEGAAAESRWQYWAVGAAALALGVLGIMAITGSGFFGGGDTAGKSAKAEAVGAEGQKAAGVDQGDAGAKAVAKADTGTPEAEEDEQKVAGLDEVGAKVVSRQYAEDAISIVKDIAESVEPTQVAAANKQGGASGGGSEQPPAGGANQGGGGSPSPTARVEQLMAAGQLQQAYDALQDAPPSSKAARLHVQLGSKFQTSGDPGMARQVYRDYLDQWPNGRFAEDLKSIIENQL